MIVPLLALPERCHVAVPLAFLVPTKPDVPFKDVVLLLRGRMEAGLDVLIS